MRKSPISIGFGIFLFLAVLASLVVTPALGEPAGGAVLVAGPSLEHADVSSCTYSPGGKFLATEGSSSVKVWDPEEGVLRYELRGHNIVWDPAGRQVATEVDEAVQVWDAATGEALFSIEGNGVVWSLDGAILATQTDSHVSLWDAEGGAIDSVEGAMKGWCPTGPRLAISGEGSVHIWNAGERDTRKSMEGTFLGWSPDGSRLATQVGSSTVALWDVGTGDQSSTFSLPQPKFDVEVEERWAPNGDFLVVSTSRQDFRPVFYIETLEIWTQKRRTWWLHNDLLAKWEWSPDGRKFAAVGYFQDKDTMDPRQSYKVMTGELEAQDMSDMDMTHSVDTVVDSFRWSPQGSYLAFRDKERLIVVRVSDGLRLELEEFFSSSGNEGEAWTSKMALSDRGHVSFVTGGSALTWSMVKARVEGLLNSN